MVKYWLCQRQKRSNIRSSGCSPYLSQGMTIGRGVSLSRWSSLIDSHPPKVDSYPFFFLFWVCIPFFWLSNRCSLLERGSSWNLMFLSLRYLRDQLCCFKSVLDGGPQSTDFISSIPFILSTDLRGRGLHLAKNACLDYKPNSLDFSAGGATEKAEEASRAGLPGRSSQETSICGGRQRKGKLKIRNTYSALHPVFHHRSFTNLATC